MSAGDDEAVVKPEPIEPELSQFEVDRWEFPDEETKAEYSAAVERLRETMREHGVHRIHARMLAQPTVTNVGAFTDIIANGALWEAAAETTAPAPSVELEPAVLRRRWWHRFL